VGARHLALGSDFDGAVEPVRGLESVTGLVRITRLLCELGWRDEEIVGVLGGNVLRVLRASGQGLCAAGASSKAHKER
jgi:membrane dipeptidase